MSDDLLEHRLHDVDLQTLGKLVNGHFLPESAYRKTLGSWEGVPVVFANEHLDAERYAKDPEAELKRVGGKVVGRVTRPRIEASKLKAVLDLAEGGAVETLLREGYRVRPSTALWMRPEGVQPHHVLLLNEGGSIQAGDPGAMVLNTLDEPADPLILNAKPSSAKALMDEVDQRIARIQDFDRRAAEAKAEVARARRTQVPPRVDPAAQYGVFMNRPKAAFADPEAQRKYEAQAARDEAKFEASRRELQRVYAAEEAEQKREAAAAMETYREAYRERRAREKSLTAFASPGDYEASQREFKEWLEGDE